HKTIMSARPRCAILLTFLNSNRECSKKDSRGAVRTSCIDAGDITLRIDERHVSNFAQYPRGSGHTMEPCGGAEAGLPGMRTQNEPIRRKPSRHIDCRHRRRLARGPDRPGYRLWPRRRPHRGGRRRLHCELDLSATWDPTRVG